MRDGPGRRLLTSVRPEVELDSKVSGVSTNLKVSPTAYDRRFAHSHDGLCPRRSSLPPVLLSHCWLSS